MSEVVNFPGHQCCLCGDPAKTYILLADLDTGESAGRKWFCDNHMPSQQSEEAGHETYNYRDLLVEVALELKRCRIFVTSREKMHPDGVKLYDELTEHIDAALSLSRPQSESGK